MTRLRHGSAEVLVLGAKLNGTPRLFLLDTGYAGPPVLSINYLASASSYSNDPTREFKNAMRQMTEKRLSVDEETRALASFVASSRCVSYTSGCTMRLMSIGGVQEQQAYLFLCDALQFKTVSGRYLAPRKSDIVVTHALPETINILTCDYLTQMAPCLLSMKKETLSVQMDAAQYAALLPTFTMFEFRQNGGAFVASFFLSSLEFHLTIDTGASSTICLSREAGDRLRRHADAKLTAVDGNIVQEGVNGERVCATLLRTDVVFANKVWADCHVLHNDKSMKGVDGYAGLAFLRAYDWLICKQQIGCRLSGLEIEHPAGQRSSC
jgi:hypothetical protein